MKKLNVTFAGTTDTTGYLFSLAKCLSAALRCGGYESYADDIVAASGFAFRMWAAADLCPSATSIWEFKKQPVWAANGGLQCGYVERLWGEDAVEAQRRETAIQLIRASIDAGVAAVAWDVSGCEWGLIIGYDDETRTFASLKIGGGEDSFPYDKLGRMDLPILSVLTVTGASPKEPDALVSDTKSLAKTHLLGREWCDNAKGLAAYDTILAFIADKDGGWNLEYYLGTYAALKWYAWRFFEKYGETALAERYRAIHDCWQQAFEARADRSRVAELLKTAKASEAAAVELM